MVGNVDRRLLALIAHKLDLVLGRQHRLGTVRPDIVLAGDIPDADLDGARIALLAVLAEVLEEQGVPAPALDGVGPVEDALPPAVDAAVQRVGAVVLRQRVVLAVEMHRRVLDAVGDAADRGAEVRGVVVDVELLRGKAEHDVVAADAELLDDGAEGEKGEGVFHGCV